MPHNHFLKYFIQCFIALSVVALSPLIFFGRKITSAPNFFEIFNIFNESELTTTLSINLLFKANLIDHSIKGLPLNNLMFLLGIPFDPPLAGINANTFFH